MIYFGLMQVQVSTRSRISIAISLTDNLALLSFFRYFNFLANSAENLSR